MEKLLTSKEVAEILRISEITAKIWISKRKFPVVKVGRLTRVSLRALQDWIDRNTEMSREVSSSLNRRKLNDLNKSGSFENFVKDLKNNEKL